MAPLMREESAAPTSNPPQPLATIIAKFNPPKPALRMVARPVNFKPVHQENFKYQATGSSNNPVDAGQLRFNNHYEEKNTTQPAPAVEAARLQQVIQWVKATQNSEYARRHEDQNFLNALPVFQLPTLPSGHYRAFEAGSDFSMPGTLLIGTFVRNWYEIKDGNVYVFLVKNRGIVIRRPVNLVKVRGVLLLKSDSERIPEMDVPIGDVQEVWEIKAFVGQALPPSPPSYPKLKKILGALKEELDRPAGTDNFLG